MTGIHLNPASLRRVGVSVSGYISTGSYHLTCDTCGTTWTSVVLSSGHLPHDWWKCPTDPSHTQDQTPWPMSNKITPKQQTVLNTLYFAATHHSDPIPLKKLYHSAAAALIRWELVEKVDSSHDWPSYRLTAAGLAYMQGLTNTAP